MVVGIPWLVLSGLPTGMIQLVSNWFRSLALCTLRLVVVIPSWLIEWCSFTYSLTPPLFYCKPVNDKGGPCHASDCDLRSGCMLQIKHQQHTKDGKPVTHQDHFRCTITCGYCGKRRHYEDECHIKKRERDKLKRQEAERQKTQTPARNPPNGDKGGKRGGKGGGKNGPPNPQRRSSAPVATPTPAATPAPAAGDPKKRPQGDNAPPEGNNSKKRRLAWMAKSLIAAGVDVKFPDEE